MFLYTLTGNNVQLLILYIYIYIYIYIYVEASEALQQSHYTCLLIEVCMFKLQLE